MLIVGTGGHAMDSFDVLCQLNKYENISFFNNIDLDFTFSADYFRRFPIINNITNLKKHFEEDSEFILGIGNSKHRKLLNDLMIEHGGKPYSLISSNATIGPINNIIEPAVSIMNGVVVTINSFIGYGSLINTNATLTHDCHIDSYVEIGPGVNIAGACTIKKHAFIGTGATILPKITIGEYSIVAAGAVVIKDVPAYSMVAGNPAVIKKMSSKS